MAEVGGAVNLAFKEQIDFFKRKIKVPTETWLDVQKGAHDRVFIVAGAAKADLLNDLLGAVRHAVVNGGTLQQFRKDFKALVAKNGWTGWTGEDTPGGVAWRTRTIYSTNIRTSFAAGRWKQLTDPDLLKARPYWRYVHDDTVIEPRPQHQAWGDAQLTLRHDHPFWQTHYPPNGWGCRCRVVAVKKTAEGAQTEPPEGWDSDTPVGVAEGWDYAPGARQDESVREVIRDKLITYDRAIAWALTKDVNRTVKAGDVTAFADDVLAAPAKTARDTLFLGFVENFEQVNAALRTAGVDVDTRGYFVQLPAHAVLHTEKSHGRDGDRQRAAKPQDYAHAMEVLTNPDRLELGTQSKRNSSQMILATKTVGDEVFRLGFEVLSGKSNRSLSLLSFVIKTGKR